MACLTSGTQPALGSEYRRGRESRARDHFDGVPHPTNTGVVEAEPLSIHRIPDVGTVVAKVGQPHVGNHSEELVLLSKLENTGTE